MNDMRAMPYRGESYYGLPALKTNQWNITVSGYIWLAGTAGAAQTLATIASTIDRRRYAGALRSARAMAVGGSAAGAGLLIADLKKPTRFYNMLRILRRTSPMSFGTYILGGFGVLSAAASLAELPIGGRRVRRAAGVAQVGAAVTGAGAATYTAALFSATSTPHWAASPVELGGKFAASSVASGAAALAVVERLSSRPDSARPLEAVAAVASGAQVAFSIAAERKRAAAGISQAMRGNTAERGVKISEIVLAGAVPLAAYAIARTTRRPELAIIGSAAVLLGGLLGRDMTMRAGLESLRNPQAYLGYAQPRPALEPPREPRAIGRER